MRTEKNGSNFTPEMFYIYNSHTKEQKATEKTEKECSELWNAPYERAKQKKREGCILFTTGDLENESPVKETEKNGK